MKKSGGEEAKLMWEIVLICTVTTFNEKASHAVCSLGASDLGLTCATLSTRERRKDRCTFNGAGSH